MILRAAVWIACVAVFFIVPHFVAEYHMFQICLIAATALVVLAFLLPTSEL